VKAYITKYALTAGVYLADGEVAETSDSMFVVRGKQGGEYFHGEGLDWHRTWEPALDRAKEMRANKLVSLRKQIAKLESLEFKEPK
jgi:hypothetical protein